jgi:hypothetical protein
MNPRLETSLLSFDWRERDVARFAPLPAGAKAEETDRLASKMHAADRVEDTMVDTFALCASLLAMITPFYY